jgi:hypothetical protein
MTLRVNPATAAMLACLALCAVPGSSHAADTITLDPRVIPVGKWAEGIAIADNKLWVAESGQRSIAQVDLNRGNVVRRVQVGRLPVGMVTGSDGAVYSLVQTDRLVWQQLPNGRTRSFGGLEGCPQGLAGSDQFLWVLTMPECSSVSSRLIRMNPNGGDPTSSRVFSEWAQAITTHQGKVWVAHARTPALTIVDEQTLSVRTANLAGVSLWAVTACCGNVHVGGRLGDEKTGGIVLSIDPATFQERRRHLVEQRIAVMADDDQSVVAVGEKGTIWVFSADRLELQRTITLATGAFDPKAVLIVGDDLYLSSGQQNGENGAVLVLSGWRPDPAPARPQSGPSRGGTPNMTTECPYEVVNASASGLWMHEDPDTDAPKVVGLPSNARGLEVDRCIRDWCHATFRGASGWVEKKNIRAYCN